MALRPEKCQIWNVVEDGVFGCQWEISCNGHCRDPSVGFVVFCSEAMSASRAFGPEIDVGVDDAFERWNYGTALNEGLEDAPPPISPSGYLSSEPHFCDDGKW